MCWVVRVVRVRGSSTSSQAECARHSSEAGRMQSSLPSAHLAVTMYTFITMFSNCY